MFVIISLLIAVFVLFGFGGFKCLWCGFEIWFLLFVNIMVLVSWLFLIKTLKGLISRNYYTIISARFYFVF